MEAIVLVVVIFLLLIAFYIKLYFDGRRKKLQFIENLKNNYGKPRDNERVPDRYENLGKYFEKHRQDYFVDDITWNDLSMGQVYHRLNYTHSSCGEEYLYYRLRSPELQAGEHSLVENEEDLIRYLQEHEKERVRLQLRFAQIGYTGKYALYQYLDFLENLGIRSNIKHYAALAAYLVAALLCVVLPSVGFGFLLCVAGYQIFSYLKEHGENEPYLVSFAFILRFLEGAESLSAIELQEKGADDLKSHLTSIKENGKKMRDISRHSGSIAGENKGNGDPMAVFGDYVKMFTHINLIRFNRMLTAVQKHREDLDVLYTQMGYLEYLLCVGEFRKSLPVYCIPEFGGNAISCTGLYHPLIEDAVPCSFREEKGVLVTGSNASGKSTFLKSVALNVILAQSMHTAAAEQICLPAHFRIFSSMSLRDDLDSGESYYMVEIRALKRIIDAAEKKDRTQPETLQSGSDSPVLCFVDEVLRGTNTVERIAASTQILKHFAAENVVCFAATHDIELTHLLENEYSNYHFEEEVSEGDISFNYELKEGRATTRNAIRLLEIMGYEASIIEEAQNLAEDFVHTGKWRGQA